MALRPTMRKTYRLTLAGLDTLERADVDATMTRIGAAEIPPAPDTVPELPPDPEPEPASTATVAHIGDVCPLCGKTEHPIPGPGNYTGTSKLCESCLSKGSPDE